MKRFFTFLSCFTLSLGAMWADTGQTVTIGGTVVEKFVTLLTFDGSNVKLTFDDNTDQTADMSLVSIDLTYEDTGDEPSAIVEVKETGRNDVRIYSISGQLVGKSIDSLPRGLYIVNGKKTIIR
ncbi:MAG: subtilase [Prevotella sp.]